MASIPLFELVRSNLGPCLQSLGFQEIKDSRGEGVAQWWQRPDKVKLCVQRYPRPWMVRWLGNRFTLGLEKEGATSLAPMDGRFWFLMTKDEVAEMRSIYDEVLRGLPVPGQGDALLDVEVQGIHEELGHITKSWSRNHEVWFRYTSREDVAVWLKFVERLLPQGLARFQNLEHT